MRTKEEIRESIYKWLDDQFTPNDKSANNHATQRILKKFIIEHDNAESKKSRHNESLKHDLIIRLTNAIDLKSDANDLVARGQKIALKAIRDFVINYGKENAE